MHDEEQIAKAGGQGSKVANQKGVLHEKEFKLKLSGNEVYYTACSLLAILKNSCSKRHCQKVLI